MKFGDRIRTRAQELGLSDSEVSRRIGVDESRVGRYVRGVNEPDLSTLVRLCDVLSLTPNDLLLPARPDPAEERERLLILVKDVCGGLADADLEIVAKLATALKDRQSRQE